MHSITEVVKIKEIIKNEKVIICSLALVLLIIPTFFTFTDINRDNDLLPSSSHIVMNKWLDKNNRKKQISSLEITKDITYHAKLSKIPFYQTKMIFKTENLRFSLYTKGKILYSNTEDRLGGYGKELHIIDIGDIKQNSELFLHLSPVNNDKSVIASDIFLTSKNDYLVNTVTKNIKEILLCIILILFSFAAFYSGAKKLIKKEKTAPKYIYFSLIISTLFLFLFLKGNLADFKTENYVLRYILIYSTPCIFGIFISCFLCSLLKVRSREIKRFNILIIAYSVLRVMLFVIFLTPLSKADFISYIIIIFSVLIPIINALPKNRKSKKINC